MYRGEKIALDTSGPLKLYYLEPWQMSSKYLKKIKMNFPLGVLFNFYKSIWLSPSVYTAHGLLGAFHSVATVAERAALSFCATNSCRVQVPNLPARAKFAWSLMSHLSESHRRGSGLPHVLYHVPGLPQMSTETAL